jgi:hypothetical protein
MFDHRKLSPLNKFLNLTKKDDSYYLLDELSPEAKDFFEGNINALLGQMPDDVSMETTIAMSKPALRQILITAMLTGYIAKTAEYKYSFEKLLKDNETKSEENFIEKYFRKNQ